MITAMTPSLNASTRAVPISSDRPERSWSFIMVRIIGSRDHALVIERGIDVIDVTQDDV
jgi:hypothetical protein